MSTPLVPRSNRLDNIVAIQGGQLLLDYISIIEKEAVEEVCDLDTYSVTFYGITEPPKIDTPFFSLFTNDMDGLRFHLEAENDMTKKVWNIIVWATIRNPFYYRGEGDMSYDYPSFTNIMWNGLTLLETAILLNNEEAITLLLLYQRRTWHTNNHVRSTYLETGKALAKKNNVKPEMIERLEKYYLLPSKWSKKGMNL